MEPLDRRDALKSIVGAAGLAAAPQLAAAGVPGEPKGDEKKAGELAIPGALKAEHDEIHEELVRATKAGGKTGEAAKAVAKFLHPHFIKEEELAMPPLGLLRPLADGPVRPEMAKVLVLTGKLKQELPTMLKEHEAIVGALKALAQSAKEEGKPDAQRLAEALRHHAKTEEEVLYPAAILVGEYVKLKLGK